MPAPDQEHLDALLARCVGPGTVAGPPRRLTGGASREIWALDARRPDGPVEPLVLRRDPSGWSGGTPRTTEYRVLETAGAGGVPVPRLRGLLQPSDDLGDGFLMDRIEGETIPRRILRADDLTGARAGLARRCGEVAARIHALPTGELEDLPVTAARDHLQQWRELLDSFGEARPAFELGLRELDARCPPTPADPVLVHGDFRNGNLVVGPDGLRAVLDWELAHLGDPLEDLGWMCGRAWRFGHDDATVGGFGDLEQLLDGYATVAGVRPEAEAVRFWVAMGTLRWGVICLVQAFTHLRGVVRSVELATIGRRVAETEWDLLAVLDGGWS